ncbi:MAG: hypothetical protein JW938_01210 [Candidatus Omnitrophica bacterium]|nr:hypothetical protein [Candidatus Omnitrophota bacterium]
MKKVLVATLLLFLMITQACYAIDYEVIASSTVSVGGSFTPTETIGGLPLIDDFNDGGTLNNLGGATGTFLNSGGDGVMKVSTVSVGTNNYAAKIDYTIRNTSTFGGYYSKLQSNSFTPYGYLYFDVRGANGGEYFKIQLQTNTGTYTQANLMITDVLGATLTTSWQTVAIPLLSFFNLATISNMNELVFVFEGAQSDQNGITLPVSGSIYLDNIRVVTGSTPDSLLIDNFNDRVGTCSLGGSRADLADSGSVTGALNGSELVSIYTAVTTWGGHTIVLGGGGDSWQPVTRNELMQYNGVSITSRIISGTPRVKVEFEVHSPYLGARGFLPDTRMFYYFDGMSAAVDFNDFLIATPLGVFPVTDLGGSFETAVDIIYGKCSIIYEKTNGYTDTGSIAIDNIRFEK